MYWKSYRILIWTKRRETKIDLNKTQRDENWFEQNAERPCGRASAAHTWSVARIARHFLHGHRSFRWENFASAGKDLRWNAQIGPSYPRRRRCTIVRCFKQLGLPDDCGRVSMDSTGMMHRSYVQMERKYKITMKKVIAGLAITNTTRQSMSWMRL